MGWCKGASCRDCETAEDVFEFLDAEGFGEEAGEAEGVVRCDFGFRVLAAGGDDGGVRVEPADFVEDLDAVEIAAEVDVEDGDVEGMA